MMKYTDDKKNEWFKTTTNYFISKVHQIKHFVPWAESFQSHVFSEHHVQALSDSGVCSDTDLLEPSRNLSGYWNLCLHGARRLPSTTSIQATASKYGGGS